MELKLKVFSALCALEEFEINGIKADSSDFGSQYDRDPDAADDYCCGDMYFEPALATQEILDKYKISITEYNDICERLDVLSFGCCYWCL